ncbi:hypothetical protein FACS1894105_07590 [Clostridia bacterium]|nr:hypothetical protein FACS1894105_07590 [Clostridia bacterium]
MQFSPAVNPLPKRDKVKIPSEKLTEYSLNPNGDPNKAIAFQSALGYTLKDAKLLEDKIMAGLEIFNATAGKKDEFGERYQVIMRMTGNNGKTANVLTAWIDDIKKDEMRMINAYVTKKGVLSHDTYKTI